LNLGHYITRAPGNIDVNSFSKRHYDNTARPETSENKANRPAQLDNSRGQSLSRACRGNALGTRGRACPERSRRDARDTNKPNFENPHRPERPKIECGERLCADESTIRSKTSL